MSGITTIAPGESVIFLESGDLATAMRASMAIPGAFAPVETDKYILSDGGMVRNIPVDVARNLCADIVIVVNLVEQEVQREKLQTATQLLGRSDGAKEMSSFSMSNALVGGILPAVLRRLAEATGLHVVTNTGYYGANALADAYEGSEFKSAEKDKDPALARTYPTVEDLLATGALDRLAQAVYAPLKAWAAEADPAWTGWPTGCPGG